MSKEITGDATEMIDVLGKQTSLKLLRWAKKDHVAWVSDIGNVIPVSTIKTLVILSIFEGNFMPGMPVWISPRPWISDEKRQISNTEFSKVVSWVFSGGDSVNSAFEFASKMRAKQNGCMLLYPDGKKERDLMIETIAMVAKSIGVFPRAHGFPPIGTVIRAVMDHFGVDDKEKFES